MKAQHLILGATGGIAYGLVKALLETGTPVTVLVRDVEKTFDLFGNHPQLDVVRGDVLDSALLDRVAQGKEYIFHGVNASYEHWEAFMPLATRKIIDAAEKAGATVVFPGNIYNFGLIREPATEITPFKPESTLGRLRVQIEEQLKNASDIGRIKTLIVRLPEVWGPNVTNDSFAPVFERALQNRPLPWLYTTSVPQQMIWNMDAGRAIAALMSRESKEAFEVFHVAGRAPESMLSFFERIGSKTGKPVSERVVGRRAIRLLGWVKPVVRKVAELEYRYTNTILLDDTKFRTTFPAFESTPIDSAIEKTLHWFEAQRVKPARSAKKAKRIRSAVDFASDNTAIVVFPLLIALVGSAVPFIGNNAVLFGVVAGIYWAPAFRSLWRKLGSRIVPRLAVMPVLLTVATEASAQQDQPAAWEQTQVYASLGLSTPSLYGGSALMAARDHRAAGLSYFENAAGEQRDVGEYGSLVGWGFDIGFYRPSGIADRLMLGASAQVNLTGTTPQSGGYSEGYYFNTVQAGLAWKYYPTNSARFAVKGDLVLSSVFTKNRFVDSDGGQAFHHQFGIGAGTSLGLSVNVTDRWGLSLVHSLITARVEVNGTGDDSWAFGMTSLRIGYGF